MRKKTYTIDADISKAHTPPSSVYSDPLNFEHQKETIFAKTWQFVPDATTIKAPGHVLPFRLLDGCLSEPLLLTRDDDDELCCLSNICTHRGALIVEGESHLRTLRCRYHGRKFHLDGKFISMPEFDGVCDFPDTCDNLPSLPLENIGPLFFTSLDPAIPFDEWMSPILERVGWLQLEKYRFDPLSSQNYTLDANWALYCDNYLDELHIPYVHPVSLGGLDYENYKTECFPWGNVQFGSSPTKEYPVFDLPSDHPDFGQPLSAFYFWLFPNLMLNFYPTHMQVNVVRPLSHNRTNISFLNYTKEDTEYFPEHMATSHRVEMEDEEVVMSVQSGVSSRLYDRGKYSPRRETGTHHFHRLLSHFEQL